ncbi:hypothetical protein BDK51DRAFT_42420 [Blyttiomyces helicus]|uniref:Uncharacterized protein n=1 Tax=Blyttiomyces helicus TaxID=388810 RepID=A0A4P9WN15_9FUNG|nr:hypothetical protein BDK51DRAFT_42420 [Blyttiomyces helicus]|eukprot:RKO94491.1 hypothetical protein BDK51DRAFT_42420 [Blyttiomyces helicus]
MEATVASVQKPRDLHESHCGVGRRALHVLHLRSIHAIAGRPSITGTIYCFAPNLPSSAWRFKESQIYPSRFMRKFRERPEEDQNEQQKQRAAAHRYAEKLAKETEKRRKAALEKLRTERRVKEAIMEKKRKIREENENRRPSQSFLACSRQTSGQNREAQYSTSSIAGLLTKNRNHIALGTTRIKTTASAQTFNRPSAAPVFIPESRAKAPQPSASASIQSWQDTFVLDSKGSESETGSDVFYGWKRSRSPRGADTWSSSAGTGETRASFRSHRGYVVVDDHSVRVVKGKDVEIHDSTSSSSRIASPRASSALDPRPRSSRLRTVPSARAYSTHETPPLSEGREDNIVGLSLPIDDIVQAEGEDMDGFSSFRAYGRDPQEGWTKSSRSTSRCSEIDDPVELAGLGFQRAEEWKRPPWVGPKSPSTKFGSATCRDSEDEEEKESKLQETSYFGFTPKVEGPPQEDLPRTGSTFMLAAGMQESPSHEGFPVNASQTPGLIRTNGSPSNEPGGRIEGARPKRPGSAVKSISFAPHSEIFESTSCANLRNQYEVGSLSLRRVSSSAVLRNPASVPIRPNALVPKPPLPMLVQPLPFTTSTESITSKDGPELSPVLRSDAVAQTESAPLSHILSSPKSTRAARNASTLRPTAAPERLLPNALMQIMRKDRLASTTLGLGAPRPLPVRRHRSAEHLPSACLAPSRIPRWSSAPVSLRPVVLPNILKTGDRVKFLRAVTYIEISLLLANFPEQAYTYDAAIARLKVIFRYTREVYAFYDLHCHRQLGSGRITFGKRRSPSS